jgi:hypothetical protein
MVNDNRRGARHKRKQGKVLQQGYYTIVTDTEATEKNYIYGVRESILSQIPDKLRIEVIDKVPTQELLSKCLHITYDPQYKKMWIVFDRDEGKNFDEIISEAQKHGIEVGWSNPCIEIWFQAYFGEMANHDNCNKAFRKLFKKHTKQDYDKAAKDNYKKLIEYGDEKKAIEIAETRYRKSRADYRKPSEMVATTTLHRLVKEIKYS